MADNAYRFFVGTKAQHKAGVERGVITDNFLLYLYDTHEIYKGAEKYGSDNFIVCTKKPEVPIADKLYCVNGTLWTWTVDGGWLELTKATSASILEDGEENHNTVPTTGAVLEAIHKAVESLDGNVATLVSTEAGIITVTRNSGETDDVVLNGVVTDPEFDEEARVLTLHVTGGEDIEIGLGEGTCIVSGHIGADNDTLILATEEDEEAVLIDISKLAAFIKAEALADTNTVSLELNENGQLEANVKVSSEDGNTMEAREDGLFAANKVSFF